MAKAVDFATKVIDLTEKIDTGRKHFRLIEQIEASSASIALNIAEGKGRYSKKEFVQYLYIARGSLYETVTLLTIFRKKSWINDKQFKEIEDSGVEIGKKLTALIKAIKCSIN